MPTFLIIILLGSLVLSSCISQPSSETDDNALLIQLEHKWFEAEFSADTIFLSSILDSTFMCVTEGGVLTRQDILKKMIINKNYRTKNEIVIDSFRLENVIINQYGNSAVVVFTDHTYGKKQGTSLEFKTQFSDVWIKRESGWKAVSSQAHY